MDTGTSSGLSAAQIQPVRFSGESVYAKGLEAITPPLQFNASEGAKIRRLLLARSLLLSEGMAPAPYAAARNCAAVLGVREPVEIYQAAGSENAAMHHCQTPVLLEIQGRLLSLLDEQTLAAVMGHELGHYLAHGVNHPFAGAAHTARRLLLSESAPDEALALARRLSMAMELTADRFGLLACRDLDAALRLEMVSVTGLPANELTWDTKAYLDQSKALIQSMLEEGETALGYSHPEHSLRAYAVWLFSESDLYRSITGQGPGTRSIKDVDDQLLQVLGRPEISLGNAAAFEEPQIEVQECALAACVLVASADGEIHDAEMQAIERVFAHLLPHWRDLLDPVDALARFQQLAPVLYATGPRAQRSLFILLTHVLAADGECAPEEIDQILAIGSALGCLRLFRSLLPAVVAASSLSIEIVTEEPVRSIPMPAEAKQARAALRVYLERVAQRGGDSSTVRRLLRLIGAPKNTEAVRNDLEKAARGAGLRIDPALGQELDTVVQLKLIDESARPSGIQAKAAIDEPGSPEARLRKAIAKMRDKLVSGDGRSPSVRLRVPRSGRAVDLYQFEDISTGLAERALEMVASGGSIVVLDGSDADAHEGSRRVLHSLIALDREKQSRTEETGADDLYLGHPFLTGTVSGYMLRAPLILYPVSIHRERSRIKLQAATNETPIANQALLRLLLRQKKIPFPESLVEECDAAAAQGAKALIEILDRLGIKLVHETGQLLPFRDRNAELDSWRDDRLEIEDCAVLGLFPQSNSDLLHDYDDLLTQLQEGKSPSTLLACAGEVLPAALKSLGQCESPSLPGENTPAVPAIPADPVQRGVLEKARSTRVLVVDGPPGTGKSQVIVNLIADALLRRERIAVVCEKRAALDVVVNRLEALGFRHLLTLVHDVHEDRRSLYQQLAARIEEEIPRPRPDIDIDTLHSDRLALEKQLSSYAENLLRTKSEISLGQAYTYHSGLDAPALPADAELADLSAEGVPKFSQAMQAISPLGDLWRAGSPWISPREDLVRQSFESLDGQNARTNLEIFGDAHQARKGFEEACSLGSVAISNEALGRIAAVKSGLEAIVASRPLRGTPHDLQIFTDVFVAASDSLDRLKLISETLQAVESMEQAFAAAGLTQCNESRMLLARAQIPLGSVQQVLRSASSVAARNTLSASLGDGQDCSAIGQKIEKQASLWRQHAKDAALFGGVVAWSDNPEFLSATAVVARTHSSILRFFSPSWWKAKKLFAEHLSHEWLEKAGDPIDGELLQQIEHRRSAAKAWVAIEELYSSLSIPTHATDAVEAENSVRQILSARNHVPVLDQARPVLMTLSMWPLPSAAIGWKAWGQRIDAYLAALPALTHAGSKLALLRQLLPNSTIELDFRALGQIQQIACSIVGIFGVRTALVATAAWPADLRVSNAVSTWDARADSLLAVLRSMGTLKESVHRVQPLLPWFGMGTTSQRWASLVESWRRDSGRLAQADRLLQEAKALNASAPRLLTGLAAHAELKPDQWAESVLRTWAISVITSMDSAPDSLIAERLVHEEEHEYAVKYRHFHGEATSMIASLALATQDENPWLREPAAAKGARRTDVQAVKEGMLKEARKQRNLLPLRTFVRRYINHGLLDALPVWLLSPETMAQLFPREACFDVVILDEASQCTVESGLPVLMRAKRAVIAGDERQMPPSNFFKAASDEEESPEDDTAPKDILDAESLLVLARSRTAHTGLAWHYRCQQEELIAFSNHAIYSGGLKTVPSVMSRMAPASVFWHAIDNAHYEDGVNQTEAEAVVDLLKKILGREKVPTVGVVTFNLAQRKCILDAIDQRRADDPTFAEAYAREVSRDRIDERPFVKNLENVQGDERDVIVFSLGHAPRERIKRDGKKELYVPARFGPVGLRGGERRLNVAVSRAKQEIHVVASFDPAMLSVASSRNEGPRLFKGFLEFAKSMASGHRNEAERILDLMRGTPLKRATLSGKSELPMYVPLKAQLMVALEREGYKCELDVGSSEFRVPLAVVDPMNPKQYCVGLFFVEGNELEVALEAHLHVPGVLQQRGWKLLRVNARDWGRQPAQVLWWIKAAATA